MNRAARFAAGVLVPLLASCATAGRRAPDAFPLDPREGLAGPFPSEVAAGWRALEAGDAARAVGDFERGLAAGGGMAARAGLVEALVTEGAFRRALEACGEGLAEPGPTAALLSACGEARARSGEGAEAFELYRRAAAVAPERPGIAARRDALRGPAAEELAGLARGAADRKDWAAAKDAAARAAALAPESPLPREIAGDAALAEGDRAGALSAYKEALARAPGEAGLGKKVAELALELSDWESAIPALDALARSDPAAWEARAAEARLAFRVANWPEAERTAARAPRLTRGQAARLLWWMVPEVREAKVTAGRIASDVLDRRDSREVVRAVSLGLLDVDPDTHRARPDAALTFPAAARLAIRLAGVVGGSAPGCLADRGGEGGTGRAGEDTVRLARACGFLTDADTPPVSGATFTRMIDRVRARPAGSVPAPEPDQAEEPEPSP